MSQHLFDNGTEEERRRKVEAMLLQNHQDIQRLWKRLDSRPDAHLGRLAHTADAFGTTTTTTTTTLTTTTTTLPP